MPQVILLNGTLLGFVENRKEVQQWLDGLNFFRRPKTVSVEPCNHLHAVNGGSDRRFRQIGEGFFKNTNSPFTVIAFTSAGAEKDKKFALVPQRNVLEVARTSP
jgi:hypothetical protein